MTFIKSVSVLLAIVALAACSSTPEPNMALQQAEQAYRAAATDPQVTARAPLELRRAEEALREAQDAHRDGAGTTEVNHRAYLTSQRVQVARERARTGTLESNLAQQMAALQARPSPRGFIVTIGDVLFATGRSELMSGAENRLAQVADTLRQNPDATIQVEGYTDSTGSSATNLRLSEERAAAVRDALVRMGVEPQRIQSRGLGSTNPVASNANAAGRQANRRVEIVVNAPGNRSAELPRS